MAKILITGAAGFLGSHLADEFIRLGHHVIGVDSLVGGYRHNLHEKVEFYHANCNDFGFMSVITQSVSVVYHCAAAPYEGLSVFSPHYVTRDIVTATTGILSASIQNRVHRFVNCSSMSRYGTNRVPFTEDMTPAPQDPYGIGKLAAELLVKNLCDTHGIEWVTAVPHNIIGARQKYDDPYRNVASIFINLMLQGRQPTIYGDGNQMRCFSYVDDVIQPLVHMAFDDQCVSEVINVGPDDTFITLNELAQRIGELLHFKVNPIYVPARPQEVYLANCSAAKARRLLGYEPRTNLDDGLRRMIEHIRHWGVKPFDYHLPLEIVSDLTPDTWKLRLF